jgi:hypothetical protein
VGGGTCPCAPRERDERRWREVEGSKDLLAEDELGEGQAVVEDGGAGALDEALGGGEVAGEEDALEDAAHHRRHERARVTPHRLQALRLKHAHGLRALILPPRDRKMRGRWREMEGEGGARSSASW